MSKPKYNEGDRFISSWGDQVVIESSNFSKRENQFVYRAKYTNQDGRFYKYHSEQEIAQFLPEK